MTGSSHSNNAKENEVTRSDSIRKDISTSVSTRRSTQSRRRRRLRKLSDSEKQALYGERPDLDPNNISGAGNFASAGLNHLTKTIESFVGNVLSPADSEHDSTQGIRSSNEEANPKKASTPIAVLKKFTECGDSFTFDHDNSSSEDGSILSNSSNEESLTMSVSSDSDVYDYADNESAESVDSEALTKAIANTRAEVTSNTRAEVTCNTGDNDISQCTLGIHELILDSVEWGATGGREMNRQKVLSNGSDANANCEKQAKETSSTCTATTAQSNGKENSCRSQNKAWLSQQKTECLAETKKRNGMEQLYDRIRSVSYLQEIVNLTSGTKENEDGGNSPFSLTPTAEKKEDPLSRHFHFPDENNTNECNHLEAKGENNAIGYKQRDNIKIASPKGRSRTHMRQIMTATRAETPPRSRNSPMKKPSEVQDQRSRFVRRDSSPRNAAKVMNVQSPRTKKHDYHVDSRVTGTSNKNQATEFSRMEDQFKRWMIHAASFASPGATIGQETQSQLEHRPVHIRRASSEIRVENLMPEASMGSVRGRGSSRKEGKQLEHRPVRFRSVSSEIKIENHMPGTLMGSVRGIGSSRKEGKQPHRRTVSYEEGKIAKDAEVKRINQQPRAFRRASSDITKSTGVNDKSSSRKIRHYSRHDLELDQQSQSFRHRMRILNEARKASQRG